MYIPQKHIEMIKAIVVTRKILPKHKDIRDTVEYLIFNGPNKGHWKFIYDATCIGLPDENLSELAKETKDYQIHNINITQPIHK